AYKQYASSMGKSFLTHVLCWIQGETDISNGTTFQEYLRRLNQLLFDYQTDISQGAMQPVLVTYQTASHTKRTPNSATDIAQAQLVAANTNPSIFLACPTYMFTYNSDGVHMPANSYRHMGSYFAKAIHSIMTKNEWKPLQPESIYRTGRVITVTMHVPVPPLVLDTTLVTNPGDYGFEVFSGDVKQEIESISIRDNRVSIVLTQDPDHAVTVKYAQGKTGDQTGPLTGARGNLRDSDNTIATLIDSNTNQPYQLFNWCPIFTLEEGFSWVQWSV
ncbi:sialate O-acetylesterase, partial [Providencia stuartii]|nr:sialate O-acetylesterase [Providencia stuartii]